MKLVLFLVPVVYAGMLVTATVHELLGHGLVALAAGGRFDGFTIRWNGGGFAKAWPHPGSPVWQQIAILAGGIVVTTLFGVALCLFASRRKADSASGLACAVVGTCALVDQFGYAFWGAWYGKDPADSAQIFRVLSTSGFEHLELAKTCWLAAAAVLSLLAAWWGLRLILRSLETQFGRGQPLSFGRRAPSCSRSS